MQSHEELLELMSQKTRKEMKDHLLATAPEGCETALLERTHLRLNETRRKLVAVRAERAKIMREVSIRQRKMTDWKGKIPRRNEPTQHDVQRELKRLGQMPCAIVARFEDGVGKLVFDKYLASALTELDGFEKIWIIMTVPEGLSFKLGRCQNNIYLCLADVKKVDVKKGIVYISGLLPSGDLSLLKEITILDIKPYLAYCEAMTPSTGNESQSEAIHTVSKASRLGSVTEDMADMSSTNKAIDRLSLEEDVFEGESLNDTVGEDGGE